MNRELALMLCLIGLFFGVSFVGALIIAALGDWGCDRTGAIMGLPTRYNAAAGMDGMCFVKTKAGWIPVENIRGTQ